MVLQMRKVNLLILAICLLVCSPMCVSGYAKINYALNADFMSKYIWRGQNLNNRSVFQPSFSISDYGFTGSIWGNQDLTGVNNHSGEFTEFDYSLDYTCIIPAIDWLSGSAGIIYYTFPNTHSAGTTEVYGGLSLVNMPLTPSIKIYRDVDELKGTYYQFSIGHTFEKIAVWSKKCHCGLSLGASIGYGNSEYNKGYFGTVNGGNINDFTLTVGLPFCFGDWTVRPNINYSTMLCNSIRSATNRSDNLRTGMSISRGF
jgi:hypothetical protein